MSKFPSLMLFTFVLGVYNGLIRVNKNTFGWSIYGDSRKLCGFESKIMRKYM